MVATPTAGGIPFHVLSGHSGFVNDDPPAHQRRVDDPDGTHHLESNDLAWIQRMEAAGHIERLHTTQNTGIESIVIIDGALPSDPIKFKIVAVCEGETALMYFDEDEITSYTKFRNKYRAKFQVNLDKHTTDEWEEILRPYIRDATREIEDTNDAPVVVDIINFIESADVVYSIKELTLGDMHRVWWDKGTNIVWVMGTSIKGIIKNYNILPERVKGLLSVYLDGNSVQQRIGEKRHQLWPFRRGQLHLNLNLSEDEKTSDNPISCNGDENHE